MTGFSDLIPAAMPYLATEHISATAGTSWQWDYLLADDAGNPVDLSSGYTFTAVIAPKGGAAIYTPTVTTPTVGTLRCTVAPTVTASDPGGTYYHEVTITRASDSAKVVVVGAGDAKFVIKKKVS